MVWPKAKVDHSLKFILDEDTETDLKNLIQINANNTREIANLLANQTELVNVEFDSSQVAMEKLEKSDTQPNISIQRNQNTVFLASTVSLLAEQVSEYKLNTEVLIVAVRFAAQGLPHPHFMSPQIIENSVTLARNLASSLIFPLNNGSISMLELVKISELPILILNFILIYYISIPLLNLQNFFIYKASALPIQ